MFPCPFPSGLAVFVEKLMATGKEGGREKAPISYQDAKFSEKAAKF